MKFRRNYEYFYQKLLATPRKMANDPYGVRDPQVENYWFKQA